MKGKLKNNIRQAVHFVSSELLKPTNPVTVNLIGAGGTGSHVLTALARLDHMLTEMNHPGLMVRVFDDDRIEPANRLRTLFASSETGLYKSVVVTNRNNRFFGTNWKAFTEKFDRQLLKADASIPFAEITVSCVDSVAARLEIAAVLEQALQASGYNRGQPRYWLDFGNSKSAGQAILSTVGDIPQPQSKLYRPVQNLPKITDEFRDLLALSEKGDGRNTCSTAGALEEQDLFINASLAYTGVEILKKMFREGMLFSRGVFLNLGEFRSQALKVA
ncbi:PRTRC system ThiF family protein [Mucilaginibacter kameinonensis]|uniref:PRTRC system ThiF family protein n=1 Tax=Mucilaginibacter kameinonensis TaxID=452286 RepID=UPI000EF76ADA|nr:PRTRC system ThiF family protein [Mucilaginibacter kameinonensis]